ncbi:hypothetical protein D3C78_1568840 [compost metagenome]
MLVIGVMRSTMALGKLTWPSIQSRRSQSRRAAKASRALRVTAPLCGRLSQDIKVKAGVPAARRLASAAHRKPNTVVGAFGCARSCWICGRWAMNSPLLSSIQ